MNQLEITQEYVTYQSQTALVTLAQQVATSRSKTKPAIKQAIQLGTQIRLGLEALNYSAFLTKPQIDEILYLLSQIATINGFPFAPTVTSVALPNILLGVVGPVGPIGPQGVTGGGYPFLVSNITTDQVIDEFPITLCGAAEWLYDVHDNQNKRVERLVGCWLPDGSQFRDDGGVTIDPEIGSTTGKITFYINYSGGNIQLIAHVISGTWTVAGSRIQIPVNGNGVILPSSLTNGSIWIGSPANTPAEWAVSGDISLSNAGVANINPGVIVNADINAAAAIAVTKLAALTPSLAVVTDVAGFLTTSLTTATQIGYLSTTTSDVQVQINSKLTVNLGPAVTGDILYYNGANWTNFPRGTNGQLLSSNAGTIAWVSGGSGITNTALNNEVMKSNGVNAVSSGMFSSSTADLILGSAAIVGSTRNLSVQGSAPNINLFIQSKGTGNIAFYDEVFTQYLGASKTNFLALYTLQSELQLKSALTSTVGNSLKVSIKTSGSPVAGLGVGIEFQTQTGVATDKVGSIIQSISTNVGTGTEAFDLAFFNMAAGAAATEKFRFKSTGDFAVNGSVGTAGQFLRSNGVGASPTWVTGSITPAGADTQIQYNNAGAFGASSSLTYNDTTANMILARSQNGATYLNVQNVNTGNAGRAGVIVNAVAAQGLLGAFSSAFAGSGLFQPDTVSLSSNLGLNIGTTTTGTVALWSNNTERLRIVTSGAWGLAGANFGTAGQVITSQGIGTAPIWATVPATAPAGVSTELQLNNAGVFGGAQITNNGAGLTTLGLSTSGSSTQQLFVQGTSANVGLDIQSKGTGALSLRGQSIIINATVISSANLTQINSSAALNIISSANIGLNATDLNLTATSGNTVFVTNGNTRMFIANSGNVGIGVTDPGTTLDIIAQEATGIALFLRTRPTSNDVAFIQFRNPDKTEVLSSIQVLRSGVNTGALAFSTNNGGTNTERMRILANGNVGIGTNAPAFNLDVSNSTTDSISRIVTTGAFNAMLLLERTGASPVQWIIQTPAATTQLDFRASGTTRMSILNNGNVGIGTTAPDYQLHVVNTTGIALKLQRGTGIATFQQDNNANKLYIDATQGVFLNAIGGGNVGIGTAAPSVKLDVVGQINNQGQATFGASISASTGNKGLYLWGAGTDGPRFYNGNVGGGVAWNGTNYIVGTDGGSNGGWLVQGSTGGGSDFTIYGIPSTGGVAQTITPANLANYTRLIVPSTGNLVIPSLSGSGTTTVTTSASGTLGRTTAFTIDAFDNIVFADGRSIFTGLITGTDIGGSALQKLAFWGKTPIVQPTTAITGATRVNGGGGNINVNDTFGGYTVAKIAAALINSGILA